MPGLEFQGQVTSLVKGLASVSATATSTATGSASRVSGAGIGMTKRKSVP